MDVNQLIELQEFFERKGWTKFQGHKHALNRIGDLISTLNEEEQYLISQILDRYLWAPNEEYNALFLRALNRMPPAKFEGIKNIIFIPISKKTDMGKIKSSLGIAYLSKASFIKYYPRYENLNIIPLKNHLVLQDKIDKGHINLQDSLIIYCDDFIGSGKTVKDCLTWVLSECVLEIENINILGLVGMASGLSNISAKYQSCFFGETVQRAITDYFNGSESIKYKDIMIEMERDIDCHRDYSLGFKKSEAAVSMVRTPNNTFPIFWNSFKRKEPHCKPIFPRF
ncbi:hypothetical protein [Algibacter sp. R77976]|uniref:phosphoribosyltransferase-like protein n=1 Tax=Algibacter sp. R77976 TaxID=3093873 RepID=UPI0037C841A6